MEEKISVIIPVYNVEAYLPRCLDSVLNNTYRNLEIICVNDGSTDGCGAILEEYARKDSRIMVITQENRGLSAARNRGMDAATGEYIAFIDSDDWIHPQFFEIMLHFQRQRDYDLVFCDFSRTSAESDFAYYEPAHIDSRELNLEGLFRDSYAKACAWGKLYPRRMVQGKRFIEKRKIHEDNAFNGLVFADHADIRVCHVKLPLYFYYVREGSLISQLKEQESIHLAEVIFQYALDSGHTTVKRVYFVDALKRLLSVRYALILQPECKELRKSADTLIRTIIRQLSPLKNITGREKAVYTVMGYLPGAYRLYRIIDDPSLIVWERNLKKNRK